MDLTAKDVADFDRLDKIACENLDTSAKALKEIRDRRLYLAKYPNFEEYCKTVLKRSKSYGYRMIAFEEAKQLGSQAKNEHQARTARSESKSELVSPIGDTEQPKDKVKNASLEEEPPAREDLTGYIIPEQWIPLFDRAQEVKDLRRKISEVRVALHKAQENKDLLYSNVSISMVISELDAAYASLEAAIPFSVCPYCQGQTADYCKACKGRGVVSKDFYYKVADPELIKIRELAIKQRKGQLDEENA